MLVCTSTDITGILLIIQILKKSSAVILITVDHCCAVCVTRSNVGPQPVIREIAQHFCRLSCVG
jgi:hypothetical protein